MEFPLNILRKFSTASSLMVRRLAKGSNPGLGYQITAIEDAAEVIQSDPEGFEGLESDLFNAHKSHRQHEFDLKHQSEKIRQLIVKKKYFRKETLPNLLTYAEKEQIKFLHSSDKEEWTVEKLSESFPASAETICKILKSNWSPMYPKRIISHDAGVFRNWERFKKGEYNTQMSTEMHEHLKKFVNRETNDLKNIQNPAQTFQRKHWHKPNCNEFSSIITSLQKINNEVKNIKKISDGKSKQSVETVSTENLDTDTYLLGKIKNKKPMTIHDFKDIQLPEHTHNSVNNNTNKSLDQVAVELRNSNGTGIIKDKRNYAASDFTEKFVSNEVIISEDDRKRYSMSTTKGRIHIPRKLWKKGATYRANDCYYDDDGEFLYRIPGMNAD